MKGQIKPINIMKNKITALFISSLIAIAPFALSAEKSDSTPGGEYQLPTYKVKDLSELPKPTYNPIPSAHRHLVGSSMEFQIRVSATGKVGSVRINRIDSPSTPNEMARTYAEQMRTSLSKWKFNPAKDANDLPVAVIVRVPVQIIHKKNHPSSITASMSMIVESVNRS